MAEKKPYLVGNVRLSDLAGFEDTVKSGVRGCFIPYDQNPSLYVGANKQTGVMTLDLDILIRETTASKSGSSHFIKLNVGKANRERFRLPQEALDSMKIVGNLFTRVPQSAGAPQGGYASRQGAPYQGSAPAYGGAPQGGGFPQPQQAAAPAPAPVYQAAPAPSGAQPGYTGDMPDFGHQAGW